MSDEAKDYFIHKAGRGWYRENSQGYTAFCYDAGLYSEQDAKKITHPNGLDGPRDGMSYHHKSKIKDAPSRVIEALRAENARLREDQKKLEDTAVAAAASLAAAISLLQRGGKKAAPSDKMFNQMLLDYMNSLDCLRETLRAALETKKGPSD